MKKIIKILVLLIAIFQMSNVMAADNITGTWQGKLVTAPGAEMVIQFAISQDAKGSYSVVLNSADSGGIKDIKANSVAYNSGVLKLEVADLSGSYEGTLKAGKIDGKWKQEGTSFPLILAPYEKPTISKKDMEKLLGTWQGKPVLPEGAVAMGAVPTFLFRFEMSKKGEFTGIVTMPDTGAPDFPLTDMGVSDGDFVCKIAMMRAEFKGKLSDKEIVGTIKATAIPNDPGQSLTLKKGEYVAQVHKLSLPKETMDQLLGEWNGPLTIKTVQTFTLTVVFRFEMTKNGDFLGFIDSPEQGGKGVPFTEATISGGKLILKAAGAAAEFKGEISADKIVGDWTQGGMSSAPLSLKKGKYVAPVYKLTLPKETMDRLSGKWIGKMASWDGKSDPSDVVFRFEKAKNGDFKGFVDIPVQGSKDMPVTEATLSDGKLNLKIKAGMAVEFKGQLSGDKLVGDWIPPSALGKSTPLSLTKEKR